MNKYGAAATEEEQPPSDDTLLTDYDDDEDTREDALAGTLRINRRSTAGFMVLLFALATVATLMSTGYTHGSTPIETETQPGNSDVRDESVGYPSNPGKSDVRFESAGYFSNPMYSDMRDKLAKFGLHDKLVQAGLNPKVLREDSSSYCSEVEIVIDECLDEDSVIADNFTCGDVADFALDLMCDENYVISSDVEEEIVAYFTNITTNATESEYCTEIDLLLDDCWKSGIICNYILDELSSYVSEYLNCSLDDI